MEIEEASSQNSGDIEVPADQMNEFFFMDADEEQERYGATTKIPSALSGNIMKEGNQKVGPPNWSV
jgi:hypothetical protein